MIKNKKNIRILSAILTLIIVGSLISFKVKANDDMPNKPTFDIEIEKVEPNPAIVSGNILVSGKIIPQDFKLSSMPAKEKDIVLVIDETIDEQDLLSAAISKIIESMNINSSYDKTRIGIISYSEKATIYKVNNESLISVKNSSLPGLAKSIKKSNSDIRNTGEALRNAEYLLHGNESNDNAEKIIILLSHREANARTVYIEENEEKFYTNISISQESDRKYEIKTDSNDKNIEYANEIGKIIKNNKDRIYTIAYQSRQNNDNDNNKTETFLKKLHETILGYSINKNYEDNDLYICKGKKKVEEIFSYLGKIIMQSYEISDIKMNITFNQGFTMNIGENTIHLRDIVYKLYSNNEEISKNILKYKADEIPFQFVIKAENEGYQKILEDINISYTWNEEIVTTKANISGNLFVTVEPNRKPNIGVQLTSPQNISINEEEINEDDKNKFELSYKITPQQEVTTSEMNFTEKEIGEVIFIVDLSKEMRKDDTWNALRNSLSNKLQNDAVLNLYKFAAIGYNDSVYVSDLNDKSQNSNISIKNMNSIEFSKLQNPFYGNYNQTKDNFYKTLREDSYFASYRSYNETRNIDEALNLAKNIFDNFGEEGKGKAIVLVNSGRVNYSKDIVNEIKSKGYKIISIDLSGNNDNNLSQLHLDLGGKIGTVASDSDFVKFEYSLNENKFMTPNEDMEKVANRLKGKINIVNSYKITPTFTFDLNDNFEYIQGSNTNINLSNLNGNELKFTLSNPIEYTYTNRQNEYGEYIFEAAEEEIYINFNVKVKDGKIGTLSFGKNEDILDTSKYKNYLEYTNFGKEIMRISLETPIVSVISDEIKVLEILKHGIYNGINDNDNSIDIDETNGLTFIQTSKVIFGALFKVNSDDLSFDLNLDSGFELDNKDNILDDIEVYRVDVDDKKNIKYATIDNINIQKKEGTNLINLSINNFNEDNKEVEIVLIYKCKIKEDAKCTLKNSITLNNITKDININLINSTTENQNVSLPDLF